MEAEMKVKSYEKRKTVIVRKKWNKSLWKNGENWKSFKENGERRH